MAAGREKDDSVFDFLYVDLERIGLLLSQVGEDGILTELIRDASTSSGTQSGLDKIVKHVSAEDERRSLTRKFNPQWLVPLRFLDLFKDRMVSRLREATLGQLVHIEGDLTIADTALLQTLYNQESPLRSMAMTAALANAQQQGTEFNHDQAELEIEMVTSMPPQVHFHLQTYQGTAWSTLRPHGLVTPPEELSAKHGATIDGRWHVVGIKDADPSHADIDIDERTEHYKKMYPNKFYMSDAAVVSEVRRRLFGRPWDSYGVTPLLIFRAIGAGPSKSLLGHSRI